MRCKLPPQSVHAAVRFTPVSSTLPRLHSLVNRVTHCRFVDEHWKNILFADEQERRRGVAEYEQSEERIAQIAQDWHFKDVPEVDVGNFIYPFRQRVKIPQLPANAVEHRRGHDRDWK